MLLKSYWKLNPQGNYPPLSPTCLGAVLGMPWATGLQCAPYRLLIVFQSEINFWRVFLCFRMVGSSSWGREGQSERGRPGDTGGSGGRIGKWSQ